MEGLDFSGSDNNLHYCVKCPTVLSRLNADVEKTDIGTGSEFGIFQFCVKGRPWTNAIQRAQYIQNTQHILAIVAIYELEMSKGSKNQSGWSTS